MRGRGQEAWENGAKLRPIGVAVSQLKQIEMCAENMRSKLQGVFLEDLRPGQRKLTEAQTKQVAEIEHIGMGLHVHIVQLQKEHYGSAIAQSKEDLQKAQDALRYLAEQKSLQTKAFEQHWAKWGEDVNYASSWRYKKEDERSNSLERYSVRLGDYVREDFDQARYDLGIHHDEVRNQNLRKESEWRRKEMDQEREVRLFGRKIDQVDGSTYAAVMQRLISHIRPTGGAEANKLSVKFEHAARKDHRLEDERVFRTWLRASESFPADWLTQMVEHRRRSGVDIRLGYYGDFDNTAGHHEHVTEDKKNYSVIRLNNLYFAGDRLNGTQHEYTDKDLQQDYFWQDHLHGVFVHEMVHHMEMIKPELGRAGNAYRVWRGMQKKPLKVKYARKDYRREQLKKLRENPDKPISTTERDHLDWRHSEILSTGLETMVSGSQRNSAIIRDDRHRAFTLGCLLVL